MKKSKLLILVLVAPLLTGCGGKVKAPKFAKEGESVSGDKFVEDFNKAMSTAAFAQEAALGSTILNLKMQNSTAREMERDKKSFSKTTAFRDQNSKLEYDSANSIIRMSNNASAKETSKSKHGTSTSKGSQKQVMSYEGAQVSGANYVVNVNQTAKEYTSVLPITGDVTVAKYDDMVLKMMIGELLQEYAFSGSAWAGMSDEEKAEYKFYENGNIYTYEYEHKVENEETKDADDKLLRVESSRDYLKVQIDFTAGKLALKAYGESEESTTYKQGLGSYAPEDVVKDVIISSVDASFTDKDVKLKSTDLSKFKGIGF